MRHTLACSMANCPWSPHNLKIDVKNNKRIPQLTIVALIPTNLHCNPRVRPVCVLVEFSLHRGGAISRTKGASRVLPMACTSIDLHLCHFYISRLILVAPATSSPLQMNGGERKTHLSTSEGMVDS